MERALKPQHPVCPVNESMEMGGYIHKSKTIVRLRNGTPENNQKHIGKYCKKGDDLKCGFTWTKKKESRKSG